MSCIICKCYNKIRSHIIKHNDYIIKPDCKCGSATVSNKCKLHGDIA